MITYVHWLRTPHISSCNHKTFYHACEFMRILWKSYFSLQKSSEFPFVFVKPRSSKNIFLFKNSRFARFINSDLNLWNMLHIDGVTLIVRVSLWFERLPWIGNQCQSVSSFQMFTFIMFGTCKKSINLLQILPSQASRW